MPQMWDVFSMLRQVPTSFTGKTTEPYKGTTSPAEPTQLLGWLLNSDQFSKIYAVTPHYAVVYSSSIKAHAFSCVFPVLITEPSTFDILLTSITSVTCLLSLQHKNQNFKMPSNHNKLRDIIIIAKFKRK
jgi:hypothetical protein